MPRLAGNFFLAGLHSLFIGQNCRFEQRFAREFRPAQKPETSCIYFNTEFLGCEECECFAGAISHCNFALCVATKLTWVGACIPPGLQNTSLRGLEAMQKLDLQLFVSSVSNFIYVPASLTTIQSLQDCTAAALLSTAYPSHKHSSFLIPATTTATILPSTAQHNRKM